MSTKKENEEMENNKKELFIIINAINNPKMVKYILGFIKALIEIRK